MEMPPEPPVSSPAPLCYPVVSLANAPGTPMKHITCIEDLRQLARRKVPRAFFDYADSGSYNEETLRANRADLEGIKLRQRVLVDVTARSLATTIVGQKVAAPFALAPIGLCGMQHGNGEILSAQAANEAGIPFTLSTMSICSIEDVAKATGKPFWFQLYVIKDRGFSKDILSRAVAAKCNALVLTVDLQVLGQRHRDIKNGMTVPPEIRLKNIIDVASKPAWAWSILNGKRKTFGNLAGHVQGMENVNELAKWVGEQFDPALSWKDVEWIKKIWPGKLILKGILDADDAKTAVKLGADTEVLFDGGIRTGADIMRALALGARACLIGRAYIYGLGAGGKAGVAKAIDILEKELSVTMALTGTNRIADIGGHVLVGGKAKKPATKAKRR